MKRIRCIPIVATLIASAASAQSTTTSARDTAGLAPVVVTATRLPTQISATTQPVTVLTAADLEARGVSTVADALRQVPGAMVVQSGSYGGVTSLFLRGGESRYTKVLVDGVPVNSVGGGVFFGNFTVDNIDRIEVVEGPSSALYGADAMSGVIQIFTRHGAGAPVIDADARTGTFNSHDADASIRAGNDLADFSLGGGWHSTDGVISFNNGYTNGTLSGAAGLRPDAATKIALTSRYSSAVYHFPTDYTGTPNDTTSYSREHRFIVGLDASRKLMDGLVLRVLGGDNEIHGLSEDTQAGSKGGFVKSSDPTSGYRRFAEGRLEQTLARVGTVTLGAQYQVEHEASSQLIYNYASSPSGITPAVTPGADDRRTTRGYYVSAQGTPLNRVSYDLSARYDDHSDFKSVTTYHAGASVGLWKDAHVRGSYGTGFNAPAFSETQGSAFNRANPALQPEQARTLDGAIVQDLFDGKVSLTAGAFEQRFSQLIQYVAGTNSGPPNYTTLTPAFYENLTQARSKGYQGEVAVHPFAGLTADASYTQTIARVYSVSPAYTGSLKPGSELIRRPSHAGTMHASYTVPELWSAGVTTTYVGRRLDTDFAQFPSPTLSMPEYVKLDLAASATVLRTRPTTLALTARVDNALDKKYEDVLHFPAPRRALFVGARVSATP